MPDPISTLGLTCPSGGQFYICQGNTTQFLGCCTSNPCADGKGTCPQADIRYASFNASDYAEIKTQACSNTTGHWYTCSSGLKSPFLGCCSTNACTGDDGCPTKDLLAARLSDDEKNAEAFVTTAVTASRTATASGTSSTGLLSVTGISSSLSATATSKGGSQGGSSPGLSTGAKAGVGVGCAVAVVALIGVLLFFVRRILRDRTGVVVRGSEPPTPSNMMREYPTSPPHHYDPNQILWSPPPLSGASNEPLAAAHAAKSPAESYARSFSTASSPSMGVVSRETSVRSGSSNGPVVVPASPLFANVHAGDGQYQQQWMNSQQYAGAGQFTDPTQHVGHRPLETVAELDGTDVSRPTSEMPRTSLGSAQSQSQSPLPPTYRPYRPYRPPQQDLSGARSEFYP